ncbi:MAG TPA: Flp pilus assembly protein CpaB [Pseudonocardiaceae bacterium]|jgi:Flp pilus assembly protein CpaB|nr:Flp pilus assembly protein CpaB [Pseudonocardiaceae bacterium]
MRHNRNAKISPLPRDQLGRFLTTMLGARQWPRVLAVRRVLAVGLIVAAGVLALRPAAADGTTSVDVLVAARDLPPGDALGPADLTLRPMPRGVPPASALTSVGAAVGRVLDGPVRAGEVITDVRLLGPADTGLSTADPSAAAVPVRLSDPGIADLLRPGLRVDVVASGETDGDVATGPPAAQVLAADAVVVTVRGQDGTSGQHGPLVVLALSRKDATQVAAASLRQAVTVTLR